MTGDLSVHPFPTVLCPNCIQQGYLAVMVLAGLPELSCALCQWSALGYFEDGFAVFPDAHVQDPRS